jgi:hypothetical protein
MSTVKYVTPVNSNGDKGISTMSKKRYFEIKWRVSSVLKSEEIPTEEKEEAVMKAVCDVMKFDPSVSRYNKDMREKLLENKRKWRQKKKAANSVAQNPEGEEAGACT